MRVSAISGIVVGFLITALGLLMPFLEPVRLNMADLGITGYGLYFVAFLFVAYGIFRLARAFKQLKQQ